MNVLSWARTDGDDPNVAPELISQILHYQPALLVHLENLLRSVTSYLPQALVQLMLESPVATPLAAPLEGTVMFADIDGFTPLAERLSRSASEKGVEELTELVNRFLEILITTSRHYGGDLQNFGGDAGMLLFTGEGHAPRAIAASLDVQQHITEQLSHVETSFGTFPMRISIGLGSGRMIGMGLGNRAGRQWLLSGAPLRAMGRAQKASPARGIVLSASVRSCCGPALESQPIGRGLHLLKALHDHPVPQEVPTQAAPRLQADDALRLRWFVSRLNALTPYLTPGLLERLISANGMEQALSWSEHRQVTVLMLSFSGFPDLTVHHKNAEALHRSVREPDELFVRYRDVIHRYDGTVNKIGIAPEGPFMMALFGAPKAHEDDPLRAVLAALELQEHANIPLRIGINTGFVFAGDVGTRHRREYTVMGDEVNLAYRLMDGCRPGEIWLGPNTAHVPSTRRRIVMEEGERRNFKGKRKPIAPFRALGVRTFFSGAEPKTLPLVGREEELATLETALVKVKQGQKQLVTLHGPAGIGKSRLLYEVTAQAEALGVAVHSGAAPSYASHLPYGVWERPLLSLLELEGYAPSERREAFREKMEAYHLNYWGALISPLLGIDLPPTPEIAALSPELREQQRRIVLRELWRQAAAEQPRLLILENAHWMPPASLDLLHALTSTFPEAPMMILITYRDETPFAEEWPQHRHTLDIALEPLSRKTNVELARHAAQTEKLPQEVERWLLKQSRGIPLFTVEAVRGLITSGILERRENSWSLLQAPETAPFPASTYGMIQSRIDQLEPPSRHLLRAATVVGEQMTVEMLVKGYGEESQDAVRRRLPQLAALGLIPGDPEGETLLFRQPLVREVAYRGLPHRIRHLIHQRLAEYLNTYREQATSNWMALLAYHAYEGQQWEMAVQANLDLGYRSTSSYLIDQAIEAFKRVIQATEKGQLAPSEALFEAHFQLGETLTMLGRYEEALDHLTQARGLLPLSPASEEEGVALAQLKERIASLQVNQGQYREALATIEKALLLPGVTGTVVAAQLELKKAGIYHRQGNYNEEETWARKSAALAATLEEEAAHRVEGRSLYLLAYLTSLRGEPEKAIELGKKSLAVYEKLQDLPGQIHAHTNLILINLSLGKWNDAVKHGQEALALTRRIHHTEGQARILANLGEVYRHQGKFIEARQAFNRALELAQTMGIAYGEALMENNLAAVALREGAYDEAQERLDRAEARFLEIESEAMLPELYRHRAELHMLNGELDAARRWVERSLELGQAQEAHVEVAQSWRVLAEIHVAQHHASGARKALLKASPLFRESRNRYGEAQTTLTEARILYLEGALEEAREKLYAAMEIFAILEADWDLAQSMELRKKWQGEKKLHTAADKANSRTATGEKMF